MSAATGAFTMRARYLWSSDRLYRIYLEGGQLSGIQIGAQGDARVGGHVGALMWLWRVGGRQRELRRAAEADRLGPTHMSMRHRNNFVVDLQDVLSVRLYAPRPGDIRGAHPVLCMDIAGRGLLVAQLETAEDFDVAIEVLEEEFGDDFEVNVRWDPTRKRLVDSRLSERELQVEDQASRWLAIWVLSGFGLGFTVWFASMWLWDDPPRFPKAQEYWIGTAIAGLIMVGGLIGGFRAAHTDSGPDQQESTFR